MRRAMVLAAGILTLAILAPLTIAAPPGKMPRIGYLLTGSLDSLPRSGRDSAGAATWLDPAVRRSIFDHDVLPHQLRGSGEGVGARARRDDVNQKAKSSMRAMKSFTTSVRPSTLTSLAAIFCFPAAAAFSKPGVSEEWCSHRRSDR